MKDKELLGILKETAEILKVPEDKIEEMPELVRNIVSVLSTPPISISFVIEPNSGRVIQTALSRLPESSDAYLMVANAVSNMVTQLQKLAVEVAKKENDSRQKKVGEGNDTHREDEP